MYNNKFDEITSQNNKRIKFGSKINFISIKTFFDTNNLKAL